MQYTALHDQAVVYRNIREILRMLFCGVRISILATLVSLFIPRKPSPTLAGTVTMQDDLMAPTTVSGDDRLRGQVILFAKSNLTLFAPKISGSF